MRGLCFWCMHRLPAAYTVDVNPCPPCFSCDSCNCQQHSCPAAPQPQARVFAPAPSGVRRCIVATNIAETSVTGALLFSPGLVDWARLGWNMVWSPLSITMHITQTATSIATFISLYRSGRRGVCG